MGCFSANSTVITSNGEHRKLADLKIGEKIQSVDSKGNVILSEVLTFLDRDENQTREFVHLETVDEKNIIVTPAHLLMVWLPIEQKVKYVFADKIQEGDHLLVSFNNNLEPRKVIKISVTLSRGVYAPLTSTGTLLVDSIAASCYAVVDSQKIAHWSFMPLRFVSYINNWFSNTINPIASRQNGIHWYAQTLYSMKDIFLPTDWIYK